MLLADICEQVVYEFADEPSGVVYPGYELRDDLQPCVYVNGPDAIHQRLVHLHQVTVVKPQSQQSGRKGEG